MYRWSKALWLSVVSALAMTLVVGPALADMQTVSAQATSGPYHLVLDIGPAENMSMNGMGGEHMIGGRAPACDMSMGGMGKKCNHHVELHVYNKASGKVITTAHVTITFINLTTHRSTIVPIATMVSQSGRMKTFHYGNNVYVAAGTYRVETRVNSVNHNFSIRLP